MFNHLFFIIIFYSVVSVQSWKESIDSIQGTPVESTDEDQLKYS